VRNSRKTGVKYPYKSIHNRVQTFEYVTFLVSVELCQLFRFNRNFVTRCFDLEGKETNIFWFRIAMKLVLVISNRNEFRRTP
jgi:hypothetical protein